MKQALPPASIMRNPIPEPMESNIGKGDIPGGISRTPIDDMTNSAMVEQRILYLDHKVRPMESNVGKGDLPGGFSKSNVMSGRSNPTLKFAKGIVELDGIKVLFDATA